MILSRSWNGMPFLFFLKNCFPNMSWLPLVQFWVDSYTDESFWKRVTCTKTRQNPTGCKSPIHFASNANAESKAVEWERSYRVSRQRDHTVEVRGFRKALIWKRFLAWKLGKSRANVKTLENHWSWGFRKGLISKGQAECFYRVLRQRDQTVEVRGFRKALTWKQFLA